MSDCRALTGRPADCSATELVLYNHGSRHFICQRGLLSVRNAAYMHGRIDGRLEEEKRNEDRYQAAPAASVTRDETSLNKNT